MVADWHSFSLLFSCFKAWKRGAGPSPPEGENVRKLQSRKVLNPNVNTSKHNGHVITQNLVVITWCLQVLHRIQMDLPNLGFRPAGYRLPFLSTVSVFCRVTRWALKPRTCWSQNTLIIRGGERRTKKRMNPSQVPVIKAWLGTCWMGSLFCSSPDLTVVPALFYKLHSSGEEVDATWISCHLLVHS